VDDMAGELGGSSGSAPHRSRPGSPVVDEVAVAGEAAAAAGRGQASGAPTGEGNTGEADGAAASPAARPHVTAAGPAVERDWPELGRQRLGELLRLLAAVLEPEELGALATTCCQACTCTAERAGMELACCVPACLLLLVADCQGCRTLPTASVGERRVFADSAGAGAAGTWCRV
jgi:hypothetical protein